MRRHGFLCTAAACLLALLPVLAAAGTSFSFRGGITWDTTPAQMMTAEGIAEGDDTYNHQTSGGFENYFIKAPNVYYVFRGEQLVSAYTLTGAYADAQASLTAQYGDPADIPADTVNAIINKLAPNTYLSNLTAWRLSDGTIAALVTVSGENYLVYLNEQRITGGA